MTDKKPYTLRDLKEDLSKLTDEQLDEKAVSHGEETHIITGVYTEDEDMYWIEGDPETITPKSELDEKELSDYVLLRKAGRAFLTEEW